MTEEEMRGTWGLTAELEFRCIFFGDLPKSTGRTRNKEALTTVRRGRDGPAP